MHSSVRSLGGFRWAGTVVSRSVVFFGFLACSSSTPPATTEASLDPIVITGAFSISATAGLVRNPASQVHFAVVIANRDTAPEVVDYGGCMVYLRLFKTADRSGTPVYDASKQNLGCEASDYRKTVAPGDSAVIDHYYGINVFFAIGVPAGHYYADVLVAPNAVRTVVPAGEVDLQP